MKISLDYTKKIEEIQKGLGLIGKKTVSFFYDAGGISLLFWQSVAAIMSRNPRWGSTIDQAYRIGVSSLPLVMLTSLFTGMVLSLQSAYQLRIFSGEQFTADLVALSVTRELGPVLTAMMVAGRVGAAIAAELGTMKVTEQIDALKSLATDPVEYLVVPRFVAATSMLLLLTIYSDIVGMIGGYIVAVFKLGISSYQYITRSINALVMKDIYTGLIKSVAFGMIISIVSCYYGFRARGGAEGVGLATTLAVVVSFILIIVSDTFFTAFFYFVF